MTKSIVYAVALACAVLSVLSTRFVVPALILCFKAIEQSFAPEEPTLVPALVAVPEPVVLTEEKPVSKPRPARRRKPSAKTLAKAQEALA